MIRLYSFYLFFICSIWSFGQVPVVNFNLIDVADGSAVALSDFSKPVAIIFTTNECAFDNYYGSRIHSLIDGYGSKVQFLLINSSVEPEELQEKMVVRCKTWNYGVPYLADKNQEVMEILGARKTPEAFILKKVKGDYVMVYRGAIDDNPQVATDVKQPYLQKCLDKILASQKIEIAEVRATGGCTIRKK